MKDSLKPIDAKRTNWYPPHIKRSAVELSKKIKKKDAAWVFGISRSLLYEWRMEAREA